MHDSVAEIAALTAARLWRYDLPAWPFIVRVGRMEPQYWRVQEGVNRPGPDAKYWKYQFTNRLAALDFYGKLPEFGKSRSDSA
jgi:hypothetical protein